MGKAQIIQQIEQQKLVAVIRGNTVEEATAIIRGAVQGGIEVIELTYTTPFVEDVFKALRDEKALIGAGTVLDSETARHAILNGANFIVSPSFSEDIAKICNRYTVPYFPGCMTIKEMVTALEAGCEVLKLFPADHFKPSFIKSVKGPLPQVKIMPTGGINADNMAQWLNSGAVAVGIGSDLTRAYQAGGIEAVAEAAKAYNDKLTSEV
jgi:2-dehydro-3-deoxyphosphogluconate aldolase / (4S)-4-hydroxy-2-oxoglutarate aldolase